MSLVEIKDFKPLFDQLIKSTQETYEKRVEMSRNNDYATENVLDYLHHKNYCKRLSFNLSRQSNTSIPEETNFKGKLEEHDGSTMILLLKFLSFQCRI